MKNIRVRQAAGAHCIKLWEVAAAVGMADSNFSRKLRSELPEEEQNNLVRIIEEIAAAKEGDHGK